jgi:hypothetical protein
MISIERSAAVVLRKALEPEARKLAGKMARAINCKRHDDALKHLNAYDPTAAIQKSLPELQHLAVSAAVFGASQLVPAHKSIFTSGRGLGIVLGAAQQTASFAGESAQSQVRKLGGKVLTAREGTKKSEVTHELIRFGCSCASDFVRRAELVKAETITLPTNPSLDEYADALNTATMSGSRLVADTAANLSTTRLAAYGFLAQARKEGVKQYQISSILDERTCPACMYMNGKTFDVDPAFDQLTRALTETDSSRMAEIAPWPGQTKADIADLFTMNTAELAARGFLTPAFHPGCRCICVPVGTVDETIKPQKQSAADNIVGGGSWIDTLLAWLTNGSHGDADGNPEPSGLIQPE